MSAPRFLLSSAVALGLALATFAPPAQARDQIARVLVDIADVVVRGGVPYYRHGGYHAQDRLIVVRDHHGHRRYYRTGYQETRYDRGYGQEYGYAYGSRGDHHQPRYDDRRHDNRRDDHPGRGHVRSEYQGQDHGRRQDRGGHGRRGGHD